MKVQPVRMSRARDTPVRLRPGGVCQFKYRRARHSSLYRRARVGPSITPPGAAVVNQAAREAHVSALRASILTPLGLSACAHRLRRLTVQISSASFRSGHTYAVNKLGLMSAKSIGTNERLLNELNAGIQFVLYFFKG